MRRKLSRRMFLHTATGAALALPLLSDYDHDAHAADPKTFKRFIVIFTPNGQVTQAWKSSGTGASFQLGEVYATALAPHKADINVIHNLDMSCAMDGPGGDAHGLGIGCMLTGTELLAGNQFVAGMGGPGSGWPGGISIDQVIAAKVGTTTQFRSLEFSMKRAAGTIWTRMSYLRLGSAGHPLRRPAGRVRQDLRKRRRRSRDPRPSQGTTPKRARWRDARVHSAEHEPLRLGQEKGRRAPGLDPQHREPARQPSGDRHLYATHPPHHHRKPRGVAQYLRHGVLPGDDARRERQLHGQSKRQPGPARRRTGPPNRLAPDHGVRACVRSHARHELHHGSLTKRHLPAMARSGRKHLAPRLLAPGQRLRERVGQGAHSDQPVVRRPDRQRHRRPQGGQRRHGLDVRQHRDPLVQ